MSEALINALGICIAAAITGGFAYLIKKGDGQANPNGTVTTAQWIEVNEKLTKALLATQQARNDIEDLKETLKERDALIGVLRELKE